jgi:RNA recognition motif-containing protein
MQSELEILFSEVGQLAEVFLPADRDTGRPRGFAFVQFIEEAAAATAIEKFDGYELRGRKLRVMVAEEKQRRSSSYPDSGAYSNHRGPKKSKSKGSRRNIRAMKRGH